jgi:hypothetical protein
MGANWSLGYAAGAVPLDTFLPLGCANNGSLLPAKMEVNGKRRGSQVQPLFLHVVTLPRETIVKGYDPRYTLM